jgi:hypothetical protein
MEGRTTVAGVVECFVALGDAPVEQSQNRVPKGKVVFIVGGLCLSAEVRNKQVKQNFVVVGQVHVDDGGYPRVGRTCSRRSPQGSRSFAQNAGSRAAVSAAERVLGSGTYPLREAVLLDSVGA